MNASTSNPRGLIVLVSCNCFLAGFCARKHPPASSIAAAIAVIMQHRPAANDSHGSHHPVRNRIWAPDAEDQLTFLLITATDLTSATPAVVGHRAHKRSS